MENKPKDNPSKVELYSAFIDFMKIGCGVKIVEKLDKLKIEIERGFQTPAGASISIFGKNLFVFDEKKYRELYPYLFEKGVL